MSVRNAVFALAAAALGVGACTTATSAPGTKAAGATAVCDRACLEATADAYIAALAKKDPAAAPFAPGYRYTENGVTLKLPDGLWRTISGTTSYRILVDDPSTQNVGFLTVVQENGEPIIVTTRLALDSHRRVTEAEAIVARFDAGTSFRPEPGALDKPRPQFTQILPPERRSPREKMIDVANSYFSALEDNDGKHTPNFAADCHRLENGFATTNRPVAKGQPRGPANMSCSEAFGLGYYREDTRFRDRRFPVVDEERGLVYAMTFFDHDATVREYQLTDGRTNKVTRTGPWTWMVAEIFQIQDGQISQVEATLLSVPYGMRPGFLTGERRYSKKEGEIAQGVALK
jgi:hypothetical protein